MEEIEVTARFSPKGEIIPLTFILHGKPYKVDSIGRNWNTKDGYHILVMDLRNKVYHLLFKPEAAKWFLLPNGEVSATHKV